MKKVWITLLALLGVAFVALAIYYFVTPAGSLPHALPGYLAHSSRKHAKHGLAAIVLALACWVLAWFISGKKSGSAPGTPSEPQSTN